MVNFAMRKDFLNRKDKVSIFTLPEILVKNVAINKITLKRLIHYLLGNALTDLFLILPTSCLD